MIDYDKRIIGKLELIKVTIFYELLWDGKKKLLTLTNGDESDFLSKVGHPDHFYQKNGWTFSVKPALLKKAKHHEKLLEYEEAAEIYKKYEGLCSDTRLMVFRKGLA